MVSAASGMGPVYPGGRRLLPGVVLPYGARRRLGPLVCVSSRVGMECYSRVNGAAILVSGARVRFFWLTPVAGG